MSVNYKEKYLKYKIKYLNLQKKYYGGGFNPNGPKIYRQHLVNQNDDNTMSINNELDDDDCAICTGKLNIVPENPDMLTPILSKLFPCNHIFHQTCILQNLNFNNTCPLCRTNIENIYNLNRVTSTWEILRAPQVVQAPRAVQAPQADPEFMAMVNTMRLAEAQAQNRTVDPELEQQALRVYQTYQAQRLPPRPQAQRFELPPRPQEQRFELPPRPQAQRLPVPPRPQAQRLARNPIVAQLLQGIDENYYPEIQAAMYNINFNNIEDAQRHWDWLISMEEEGRL